MKVFETKKKVNAEAEQKKRQGAAYRVYQCSGKDNGQSDDKVGKGKADRNFCICGCDW